jgi:tetratricopeptide (TPR) repeat protein
MEGTKNKALGLIILLVLTAFGATAQKKDLAYYQCAFFESYKAGTMTPWPALIDEMEKANVQDAEWQTEMVKAMYGLVGYQIGQGEKDAARKYIDKADGLLEKLLEKNPKNARLHALSGAFYGFKISLAAYKAPFLGPKSLSHIEKAISLDPNEPTGYIEKGNSLMYRPAAFGGDKEEGLALFRKALALMDARAGGKCDWQKMLLRTFIIKGLYETKRDAEAQAFVKQMEKEYGSMDWINKFVGTKFMDSR